MTFDPKTILLVNFGRYAKDHNNPEIYKDNLPSLPQLPLVYGFDGFDYLDLWSSPNEALGYGMKFDDDDAETIQQLAETFGTKLNLHIKCEGRGYRCTNEAVVWVLPYERQRQNERRIRPDSDGMVNQTLPEQSLFCCDSCQGIQKEIWEHGRYKGLVDLEISFRLPDQFNRYGHDAAGWNLDHNLLHGKLKGVMAHLIQNSAVNEINTRQLTKGVITKYAANVITARLLGISEEEIPKRPKDITTERNLNWTRSGQMGFQFGANAEKTA